MAYCFQKACKHKEARLKSLSQYLHEFNMRISTVQSLWQYMSWWLDLVIYYPNPIVSLLTAQGSITMHTWATVKCNHILSISIIFFLFFECYFTREDSVSQRLFFSCALSHTNPNMSQFNSWVAGARVRTSLTQGNTAEARDRFIALSFREFLL